MNDEHQPGRVDADEGFLSRWSRRKRQVEPDEPVAPAVQGAEAEPAPEPVLTDADMPPVESLDEGSDYSGFFSPGVSDELRQLALRKLFRAATFNVTDGLDDYDDDFTSFAKLGDIVTREMRVREAIDEARERAKAALAEAEAPAAQMPEDLPDADAEDEPEVLAHGGEASLPVAEQAEHDNESSLEEQAHEQPSQPA